MNKFRKWQLDSAGQQQTFYERFGDRNWDVVETKHVDTLNTKIAFTFHGKPISNCTHEELISVAETKKKLLELSSNNEVNIGFVFIFVRPKNSNESYVFPLLRTKKTGRKEIYFLEKQPGRIYEGWRDFLENNKLPKGDLCYPKNGFYKAFDGRVKIAFRETPSCNLMFRVLDVVSVVSKITSSGLLSVSVFFPMMAPIVLTAGAILGGTTVYTTSRSISKLVDRGKHHESLTLTNREARTLWIDVSSDIIGGILTCGAKTLPRLLSSGRLSGSAITTSLEILSWVSVGVNSFGVLANITTLIIKFREGTLERSDIEYFITCCLLVSNLIVTTSVAQEIISELSHQPRQIHRYFKMVANTAFSSVKGILLCVSVDSALKIICGPSFEIITKYFNMPRTMMVVQEVANIVFKLKKNEGNPVILCAEIYKLLENHMSEVRAEIEEAGDDLRNSFDYLANKILTVNGKKLFHNSCFLAPEITSSVNCLLQNLQISDELSRKKPSETLTKFTVELSRKMNIDNERKFADVCKILMNDVKSRCDRRIILNQCENLPICAEVTSNILNDVINELKEEFQSETSFSQKMNEIVLQSDELLMRQLYKVGDVDAYAFETNDSSAELEKFINSATCKLLRVDSLPPNAEFYRENEHITVILIEKMMFVFCYEKGFKQNSIIGIILVIDRKSPMIPFEESFFPSSSSIM